MQGAVSSEKKINISYQKESRAKKRGKNLSRVLLWLCSTPMNSHLDNKKKRTKRRKETMRKGRGRGADQETKPALGLTSVVFFLLANNKKKVF